MWNTQFVETRESAVLPRGVALADLVDAGLVGHVGDDEVFLVQVGAHRPGMETYQTRIKPFWVAEVNTKRDYPHSAARHLRGVSAGTGRKAAATREWQHRNITRAA
jgi:hypothetical protein